MAMDSAVSALMIGLGRQLGLGALAFDENGECGLRFANGLKVIVQWRRGKQQAFWLHAELGVPAADPTCYVELLRGNLFWRDTGGATIGLSDEEPPRAVISLAVPSAGLEAGSMAQTIRHFVAAAETWLNRIDGTPASKRSLRNAYQTTVPSLLSGPGA